MVINKLMTRVHSQQGVIKGATAANVKHHDDNNPALHANIKASVADSKDKTSIRYDGSIIFFLYIFFFY
jgi:hypothetical protein